MAMRIESVQLAGFTSQTTAGSALELWQLAFDDQPNSFSQHHESPVSQAAGVKAGCTVSLSVQPMRVDLVVAGPPAQNPTPAPPPLPDLDQALELGLAAFEKIWPAARVARTAVVFQAHSVWKSGRETVDAIRSLVPGVTFPAECADATYQVVVPTPSGVKSGRVIHQLCRWQTVQLQMLQIGAQPAPLSAITGVFAAHTYVDIYAEQMEALTSDSMLEAFQEVIGIGRKILEEGLTGVR